MKRLIAIFLVIVLSLSSNVVYVNATTTESFKLTAMDGTTEIGYDDGSTEAGVGIDAGDRWAVRFTPLQYPVVLRSARINIEPYWPDNNHEQFTIEVYDDNGPGSAPGTLLGSVNTTADSWGWWEVDISGLGITVTSGDFYIAYLQLTSYPDCEGISIDLTTSNARCWSKNHNQTSAWALFWNNLMIRAVVDTVVPAVVIFRPGGTWFIDLNHTGNFDSGEDWTNSPNTFGRNDDDVPLAIDWNGDGIQELAIFRQGGTWFIDVDHNGAFEAGVDWSNSLNTFGRTAGDVPLAVDWNGDGIQELAIFRPDGTWFIDLNHNGAFEADVDWTNSPNTFGRNDDDVPLAIDWNGDGIQELAIFRPGGTWFIDLDYNGAFDLGVDWTNAPGTFGRNDGDVPLAIDWNGDGTQELAIFRQGGTWFIDTNRNGTFEAVIDWTNSPNTFGRNDDDVPLAIRGW